MTTDTPRRGDALVAALADAFDTVAPSERPAAEQELLDAGLDPTAIAARFAAIASSPSRHTAGHALWRPAAPAVATSRRRWWRVAMAAALIGAIAAALLTGERPSEHVARTAPVPRAIAPPFSHSAAPSVGAASEAQRAVGGEPPAQGTAQSITPVVDAVESAAETEAIARAAGELRRLLRTDELLPAIVASSVARQKLALREITVTQGTIDNLQSPAFVAASFANDERYSVDPRTCRLMTADTRAPVAERFGLPFRSLSRDARRAGCEIMWNVEAAFAAGGGHRGRASVCMSGAGTDEQCSDLNFESLSFVGRQSGPIANPSNLRAASFFRTEGRLAPDRGTFISRHDPLDDSGVLRWFYIPELRRVRRLGRESGQADGARGVPSGLAFAASQRNCYDANPEAYSWTLIGVQEVLAPLSGEGIQLGPSTHDGDGTPSAVEPLTVMRRPALVVAATEGGGLDRRLVLYIDAGLFRPYWKTEFVGDQATASYACAAAWGTDGEVVAPLTSSVIRFGAEGTPVQRFTPYGEVLDQTLREDAFTIPALMTLDAP